MLLIFSTNLRKFDKYESHCDTFYGTEGVLVEKIFQICKFTNLQKEEKNHDTVQD